MITKFRVLFGSIIEKYSILYYKCVCLLNSSSEVILIEYYLCVSVVNLLFELFVECEELRFKRFVARFSFALFFFFGFFDMFFCVFCVVLLIFFYCFKCFFLYDFGVLFVVEVCVLNDLFLEFFRVF